MAKIYITEEKLLRIIEQIILEQFHAWEPPRSMKFRKVNLKNVLTRYLSKMKKDVDIIESNLQQIDNITSSREKVQMFKDCIERLQIANRENVLKEIDFPYAIDDDGVEFKSRAEHLDDESWELRAQLYKLKDDCMEHLIQSISKNDDSGITIELRGDECSRRVIDFYNGREVIGRLHCPVPLSDLKDYTNVINVNKNLSLRPEDKGFIVFNNKIITDPKVAKEHQKQELIKQRRQEEVINNSIAKGTIKLLFNDKNNFCIKYVKKGVNPTFIVVNNAYDLMNSVFTDEKGKPILFKWYDVDNDSATFESPDYEAICYSDGEYDIDKKDIKESFVRRVVNEVIQRLYKHNMFIL